MHLYALYQDLQSMQGKSSVFFNEIKDLLVHLISLWGEIL